MEEISIFNIGEHAAEMNASMFAERPASSLFDPKLKDANDVKALIIRPIPNVLNPLKSTTSKRFYVFNEGASKIFFDSMTTFNDPANGKYEFCPVSDLWMKVRNASDDNVKKMVSWLPMQTAYYAYVQIVKYPAEPTMDGKIVPMRLPVELIKLFSSMAKPNEQELALGKKPVQPFDMFGGCNIQLTITGKMVDGTLMRDWKCEVYGGPTNLQLPLGPNGAWTVVSQLPQQAILDYLTAQQPENLEEVYGYHEPTANTKLRVKMYMHRIFDVVPGLKEVIDGYFPELAPQAIPTNQNAQTTEQTIEQAQKEAASQGADNAPAVQGPAGGPAIGQPGMAGMQPGVQPGLQGAMPGIQPQVISAGNPMNTAVPGAIGSPAAPAPQPEAQAPSNGPQINLP